MEIRLLGPVEVGTGGRVLSAGPPQQRLVLAAVAVDAPRPVPLSTVVDRVWDEDPPKSARIAVAARVTRLRQLFAELSLGEAGPHGPVDSGDLAMAERAGTQRGSGAAGGSWLAWRSEGYQLLVDPDAVDLLRFRVLAREARRVDRSDGDRVALLDEALALWRGRSLEGLSGDWAARMRNSWEIERVEAVLEWGRAALRLVLQRQFRGGGRVGGSGRGGLGVGVVGARWTRPRCVLGRVCVG
jgi:transcriptional activator